MALVSVAEAACRAGIPETNLRRWVRQNYVPAYRVGHTWAVDPAQVQALLHADFLPPHPGRIAKWRKPFLVLMFPLGEPPDAGGLASARHELERMLKSGDEAGITTALANLLYLAAWLDDSAAAEGVEKVGLDLDTAVQIAVRYLSNRKEYTAAASRLSIAPQ